ncbi:hypothetical protein ABT061_39885 [Streptosporangium sp. NPDC002544]|uniref:hypothetical protein n=1 Tax=Streptosporangium sp. NPDC002544 TaxID=3154538 RepID=UPI00332665B5
MLREAAQGAGAEGIAGRLHLFAGTVRDHLTSAIAPGRRPRQDRRGRRLDLTEPPRP